MQDRAGDRQDEQKKDQATDQKEQEVLYLQSSPAFFQRLEEKNHRSPFAAAKALAIDQVDEDRYTNESAKPKQT
tara:strand:- start:2323 stop:2544 length:222 start_codon:yes stop_codon:yes gene_type:complete